MDNRPLDITVISASDLKNVNLFMKMRVYVVVSLINRDSVSRKKTHVSNGGCNPTWNHRIKFSGEESAIQNSTLLFVLRSRNVFGDREIGEVSIPVSDLFNTANGFGNIEHVVDYQVRRSPRGKARGTLTFSYQFKEKLPKIQDSDAENNDKTSGEDPMKDASYPPGMVYVISQQGMSQYPQPPYPGVWYGGGWYAQAIPGVYPYPSQQMGYEYNQQVPQEPPKIKG